MWKFGTSPCFKCQLLYLLRLILTTQQRQDIHGRPACIRAHCVYHCHLMAVIDYSSSFQNSLMAAAYCFQVYYCHENHLFHPAKGAPQKRDDLPRKRGTLLVPLLRCPPSILMGNGGGTPPPPSLFTGAQSFIAYVGLSGQ